MYIGPDRNRSRSDNTVQRQFWNDAEQNRGDQQEIHRRKFEQGTPLWASLLIAALIIFGFILLLVFRL